MESLAQLDEVAYVRFASVYRDFATVRDFEEFIRQLPEDDACRLVQSAEAAPAVMTAAADRRFMAMALALAERGLGNVWPNPAVGCVLVKDGRVVGRGWTQPGGRPHAESEAIDRAGAAARGSTAYVTLEPCAHHGRTPPCVDLMLGAGIARAVVAAVDPDPRVDGKGIARLRAAGMAVEVGCLEAQACRLNGGFFRRMRQSGRSWL